MGVTKAKIHKEEVAVEVEEIEMGVEDDDDEEDVDIEGKQEDEEQDISGGGGGGAQEGVSGASVGVWMGLGKRYCPISSLSCISSTHS